MKSYHSEWADRLSGYVKLKRALGFQFERQTDHLHAFDEYLLRQGCAKPLAQELVIAFATEDPSGSMDRSARRYQAVRGFCEYLASFDPRVPALDPKALPLPKARPGRQILTDEELARLLNEARQVSRRHPMRGITLHAMIGLASSTGLRIGEVIRLDRADVDLDSGVLHIRRTKFRKDRYVPAHLTTLQVLRSYASVRDSTYPECQEPAFFVSMWQKRFHANTLQQSFCKLARRLGLRGPTGRGLSFHDLRHRFATKRLVAFYQAGVDVQAMLPALATYMGHVHYTDTAYYLTATPELLGLAAERYQRACSPSSITSSASATTASAHAMPDRPPSARSFSMSPPPIQPRWESPHACSRSRPSGPPNVRLATSSTKI